MVVLRPFKFAKFVDLLAAGLVILLILVVVFMMEVNGGQQRTGGPVVANQATPTSGSAIELPFTDVTLTQDAQAAPFSQEVAMQIVKATGVPWALGGTYAG
ncbi:MAG TPA: hypothetical protein VKU87_10265, partial [Thermomicrobiaceae bacterium]|nr:hypothetical protein [Thermomicrobiaceae bacterium]